jgi:hypothetical protein
MKRWVITTTDLSTDDKIMYLAWQNPTWDDDGYFWTDKEILPDCMKNDIPEHPFTFDTRVAAIKHLKSINIPQKCRVIEIDIEMGLTFTYKELLTLSCALSREITCIEQMDGFNYGYLDDLHVLMEKVDNVINRKKDR